MRAPRGVFASTQLTHVRLFDCSTVVPVFDSRVQWHGVKRINLGGKALTNHLKELVSYRCVPGACPSPSAQLTQLN